MKKLTTIIVLAAISYLLLFSCANGSNYSSSEKTLYKATSGFTEYTQKTIAKLDYNDFPESSITNKDLVPDVFVARATDPNETWYLSDDKIELAIRTCLAGKTVLLGAPSTTGVIAFGARVTEVLQKEGNEALMAESSLSRISLYNMLNQFFDKEFNRGNNSGYNQKAYDAVAIRNGEIYFVHDIDEVYDASAFVTEEEEVTVKKGDNNINDTVTGSKDTVHTGDTQETEYSTLEAASIKKFVNWISGKEDPNAPSTDSRSLFDKYPEARALASAENDEARKAQRFVHNFVANADAYSRKENVEVLIDVWAYCQIDQQIEWYYVRTSVICNNDQLNFKNWWDQDKTSSSYFKRCVLTTSIDAEKQAIRTNDCKPQNSFGSTKYSTGINVNFGGNIGGGGSGPTAGFNAGVTWTDSKTTELPDISTTFTTSGNKPSWTFTGRSMEGEVGFATTSCDNPPAIQISKQAQFDTLSIFTLPSSYRSWDNNLNLETVVHVTLERITGEWIWWEGLSTWLNKKTTSVRYIDCIQRPCNSKADYIMYFVPPEGTTPERVDLLTRELKEVLPSWDGSKLTIYERGGELYCDRTAKWYFWTILDKINKNKAVLKTKGFEGKFEFRIKNANSSEEQIDSSRIEF